MKTLNLLFVLIIAGIIATSCTIKQTINYNEDFSGTQHINIEMGELMNQLAFMQGEDADLGFKKEDFEGSFDDLKKDIEGNGISNFKSTYSDDLSSFGFQFDFKDTKALNQLFNKGESEKKTIEHYALSKKSLSINYEDLKLNELLGEGQDDETQEMASMMGMMDMFTFETEINFPFEIKSVSNNNYTLSADKKTIKSTFTFDQLVNNGKDANVKIAW